MMDFVKQKIYPFVYNTNSLAQMANQAIGKYPLRFTFRFVNNSENFDNSTNPIFKGTHNSFDVSSFYPGGTSYIEIQKPEFNIVRLIIIYSVELSVPEIFGSEFIR